MSATGQNLFNTERDAAIRQEHVGEGSSENLDIHELCKKHYYADNLNLSNANKCGMSNQRHKTDSEFVHKWTENVKSTDADGKVVNTLVKHQKRIPCVGKDNRAKMICASKPVTHGTKHFNKDGTKIAGGKRRRRKSRKKRRKSRKSRKKRRKSRKKRKSRKRRRRRR
jgi:hypothetical protein